MFLAQRSFIYFPGPAVDPSGRLELRVAGKRVLVAHRPHPGPRALIYFGGNAEDVSLTRAELAALLPDTASTCSTTAAMAAARAAQAKRPSALMPGLSMPTWPSATAR
jgi:hypothetical protein